MSEEEKNAIREQHTGGMKVMTESFNKLLNSKLGDAKPLVNEAPIPEPEPVFTDDEDFRAVLIFFDEGQYDFKTKTTLNSEVSNNLVNFIKQSIASSIPTIKKFHSNENFKLPSVMSFYVGTSSSGDYATNRKVAQARLNFLQDLGAKALESFGISEDVAYKLIVGSEKKYTPSRIDRNFYDPKRVKPLQAERICSLVINPITTKGRTQDEIGDIQGGLIDASSIINFWGVDNVDEEMIVDGIKKLQTYSDISDLNKALLNARKGTLESFLNDQLSNYPTEKHIVINHLNDCAKRSGKSEIAKISQSGDITILM